ncbi:hypothetical protein DFH08DRAFT_809918 [Mycena albidolilacea]|uniref:DUF6534 domain-containing protein n=1 Tax=Mycena albidolilacea TaxID=1033008 RepID=A0AAD7EQ97_9AGAR|nr:hypothetical protein DFH08DRAFT_809918 [Mycena albidolilacea]
MSSPQDIHLTLGPLIAGTFSAVGYALHLVADPGAENLSLSTIVGFQTFLYFQIYGPKDEMRYKLLVAGVWLVDASHTVFICLTTWDYAIPHFGDKEHLAVISDLCFQYVHFTIAFKLKRPRDRASHPSSSAIRRVVRALSFVSSAVADIVISAARYYYLRELKQGYIQTREVVDTVVVFTINDGLLTSVIAITMMGCVLAMHTNFVWIGLFFNLAPLFSNSILATLNLRNWYRHMHRPMGISLTRNTAPKSRFAPMSPRTEITPNHSEIADIDIQVNKEIEYHVEMMDKSAMDRRIPEPVDLKA